MTKEKAKFKFSSVFFGELEHKATITYDNTPEEQKLLDAILQKVLHTMPRTKALKSYNKICEKQKNCNSHKDFNDLEIAKYKKPFAYLEVTKDEFHTWYEGWLDFYLNSDYALPISETFYQKWSKNSNEKTAIYKEAKRLLSSMYKVFGKLKFDQNEFAEFNNQTKTWSVA
jgi:predicted metal-dependent phosphoesterase TrpH